jgi:hypothetical protein
VSRRRGVLVPGLGKLKPAAAVASASASAEGAAAGLGHGGVAVREAPDGLLDGDSQSDPRLVEQREIDDPDDGTAHHLESDASITACDQGDS